MLSIDKPGTYKISLLHLGFRPFFLLAGYFAIAGIGAWAWLYLNQVQFVASHLPAVTWHAHEMIYGYSVAVATGFLLTAVRNWTSFQTPKGWTLLALALTWLAARIVPFVPINNTIQLMAVFDLAYNVFFILAVGIPLYRARHWKHLSIWSKLIFLLVGNALFYAGLLGIVENGVTIGLYTGLYVMISLILLMGRRVIPFFIERGVGYEVSLVNRKWVDLSSLVLMMVFLVVEVFWPLPVIAGITALLLFALHLIRFVGWYTPGIWRKPMLWSIYLGYGWIVFAFLLRGLALFTNISPLLAVHAFAIGGIGMITLGMMARVSLGHTGRDVYLQLPGVAWMFALLGLSAVTRVFGPLLLSAYSTFFIGLSQILWVVAFVIFVSIYTMFLIRPRVDGRYG